MTKTYIFVAGDFSDDPYGRTLDSSDASGELFRRAYLVPALLKYDQVIVDLDGVKSYGLSFLDEAFGGLVFAENFELESIKTKLSIRAIDYVEAERRIWKAIEEAANHKQGAKNVAT